MSLSARISAAFAVFLASLLLLWPALVQGRPPVFADTAYYLSIGEYASELGGLVAPREEEVGPGDPVRLGRDAQGRPTLPFTVMGARSPVYGLFLYWTQRIGTLWLTGWLQALALAWTAYLLAKGAAPRRPLTAFAAVVLLTAAVSPSPFFTGFAMPDVFGGVAAGCALALLVFSDRYGGWERGGLIALLLFALTVHGSNPLMAAGLGVVGGLSLWALQAGGGLAARRGLLLIALAIGAVAIDASAFAALGRMGGEPLTRPPFLTARLLADGPGRSWLRRACAEDPGRYVICADAWKRLANSEHILWRDEPWLGVFSPASFERRRAMSGEDSRFALDVLVHDPIGVGISALNNWRRQIADAYVDDPLTNQGFWMQHLYWRRTNLAAISVDPGPCLTYYGCPSKIPFRPVRRLHLWAAGLAAAWLAMRLAAEATRSVGRRERCIWDDPRTRLFALAALTLAAVLINAAVCGMISGPFPRYQARVVWLLPAATALLELALFPGRRAKLDLAAPRRDTAAPITNSRARSSLRSHV